MTKTSMKTDMKASIKTSMNLTSYPSNLLPTSSALAGSQQASSV
jgi:hypothetical protein